LGSRRPRYQISHIPRIELGQHFLPTPLQIIKTFNAGSSEVSKKLSHQHHICGLEHVIVAKLEAVFLRDD
jgi:hypothetical protein